MYHGPPNHVLRPRYLFIASSCSSKLFSSLTSSTSSSDTSAANVGAGPATARCEQTFCQCLARVIENWNVQHAGEEQR